MSKMVSVYSHQSSRDPAGVDPSGADVIHGADPPPDEDYEADPPMLPPVSPAGPPPPTPRRVHSSYHGGIRAPSPVMAFLVGDPPPPPPTPPPQKFRSASSRRYHNAPVSPPGDSSTTTGYSSLSSAIYHPKNNSRREPRDPVESNSNTSTYIDQMRREALAIYESPDLYMQTKYNEDDEPELAPEPRGVEQQVADDYSFHSIYNNSNNNDTFVLHSSPAVTNTHLVDQEIANNPNPMVALVSPRSAATEPHSNKRAISRRNPKRAGNDTQEEQHSTESSAKAGKLLKKAKSVDGNVSSVTKRRGRESTGVTTVNNNSRGSKTPERRGRGRSLEKRAETPEREKRGFFQKLFRGGKKKSNADQGDENTNESADAEVTKTNTKMSGKSEILDVLPQESDKNESQKLANKPQGHGQNAVPIVASSLEVDMSQKNRHIKVHISPRNDEDDELDLGLGLDTVTSGLTNDVEPDRRDIFFAHDEVSTLTAPSAHSYGRRSVDPIEATVMSGMSSEPVGRYWSDGNKSTPEATKMLSSPTNDPFDEPFFKEPDGESPITSKHVPTLKTKTKLQVHVHPTQDPAGEAPRAKRSITHMNEPSPRGWISPITELKDPLGSTISESASKRFSSGFGKQNTAQPPKIPPGQITPHELRREPSAFRDGSPYALDPPLRVHEGDEKDNKSLVDMLRTSPTGSKTNLDRVAVEPPTPSLIFGPSECQPPTPSVHSVRSQEVGEKQRSESITKPTPSTREQEKIQASLAVPHLQKVNEKDQDTVAPSSNERAKSPKKAVGPEKVQNSPLGSQDESGFLDDLFEEKPKTQKRPSIVRPIIINSSVKQVGKPTTTDDGNSSPKQSPNSQVIEIHRTQRLSGSPRSSNATFWGHKGNNDIPSPPVSPLRYNKRRALHGDEEKKEQEHELSFSLREESPNKSMLATGTAALSTAASMNAKTVAYLHTLNGEPSPRHSWRRADLSDEEYSPVKSEHQRKAVTNIKVAMSKKRTAAMCRTDEAAFDTFIASAPIQTPPNAQGGRNKSVLAVSKASLSVHSSLISSSAPQKTQMMRQNSGRGKTTIVARKSKPSTNTASSLKNPKIQVRGKYGALSPRSRKAARANFKRPVYWFRFSRDVRVSGAPLSYGLDLLRKEREEDIINGRITPAYRTKKAKPKTKKPNASSFQPLRDEDIKDPIQRAGRRLLSKAAIPIQCAARKYLARREASSRLQTNIVLQSYFRRWKCEAFLGAYKHACTKIQAAFRSWLVRDEITYQHYNATLIQKIVRGYIAAAYVYDTIYWVSRLQAAMRGKLARVRFANQKKVRKRGALQLQAWYRGCNARSEATSRRKAACSIQACYRSYSAQITYQATVADIITTQSAARRLLAKKELDRRRLLNMNEAACKIQAAWRGFQGYTDYIFALVDILVLQRSMRKWLAMKKVGAMRRERAAIKIQSQWRRQQALIGMLYDLVHIIIAQSVVRRFLARKVLSIKRKEYSRRMRRQQKLDSAASKVQTAWRGFWGYSHFIIMQYEIIRLQAIVRGRASRVLFSLKLGCCIMIQSAVRRFLATKKVLELKFDRVALNAKVESMRMKFACQKVQFWWRVVMECSKEKKAALVIERFFLMVKAEVDKEIVRQRQIHQTQVPKRGKQSRGANDPDDKLLERVWLNTVDEDHVDIFACTSQENGGTATSSSGRSKSASRLYQNNPSYFSEPSRGGTPTGVKHHPSSPTMNLVMRHEYEPEKRRELELQASKEEALKASRLYQKSNKPPPDVTLARSDERTEVSAITSPTVFNKSSKGKQGTTKHRPKHQHQLDDELSVDDSLFGEELIDSNQKQMQSAPNNWSKKHHFFSEDTKTEKKQRKGKPIARRHHSTSSIASGSDASDWPSHLYSRTATTITRTTASHSHTETMDSMGLSPRSECNTDLDMRKNVNQVLASPLVDQKYGSDKYMSAASKGRKLLENVRKGASNNFATIKRGGSPRHGNIVVTNRNDFPILSQDSRDNVEVEYVGEQFGVI